ncbi:putative baseplate assembly protein [Paraburkholderia silviterrae]|uniref:Putative baseplate assembly protein n=1 Tax=Paraburkholderia silviterrae TaxID=2528715 RepID=A0A4R5LYL5_9BURK|nr:putative baseplate assembly protein [Paraburkholderia silviterrae]TDG17361.1 putative baseplate assembly protein [Paraburkholderia silviterrae]
MNANMNANCDCNCCTGVGNETPASVANRPGLPALAYRVGTWAQFRASMVDAMSSTGGLVTLKTRSDDDFTIALVDAFAVVCDILTFYSERSANEHYLGTATDPVSVQELAKLVGYRLAPGVAASVPLALTLQTPPPAVPGAAPSGQQAVLTPPCVQVAAGLQAQSVPAAGGQPVTYETIAPIEARASWNALKVRTRRALASTAANAGVGHLRLAGLVGAVQAGDWLLVVVTDASGQQTGGVSRVAQVSLDTATQTTVVQFDNGGPAPVLASDPSAAAPALTGTLGDAALSTAVKGVVWSDQADLVAQARKLQWPIQQLEDNINALNAATDPAAGIQVFRLGVRAALFGNNAPAYATLPNFTPIGSTSGGATSVLPNWDKPAATVQSDLGLWNGPSGWLSLDQVYPALVVGGWVVLQAPELSGPVAVQIAASAQRSRTGYMLASKVTLIQLGNAITTVGSNAASTLGGVASIFGGVVSASAGLALRSYISYFVPAKASQIQLEQAASPYGNLALRTATVLGSTDSYGVAAEVAAEALSGASITLACAQLGLQVGQQIALTGAASDQSGRIVSEVRTIASLALVDGYTQIGLDLQLTHSYAPATVAINANVASATEGATKSEILGSGSGAATWQRFTLKQPPLTYVSASTPSGTASTLTVRVNGAAWSEVPWLVEQGSAARVFTTFIDASGNTVVEFGDGVDGGARLPSGTNNVTATYRQGIGSEGNVAAGRISTLLTRPAGLQSVINPVAAAGGGDPETLDSARLNAPIRVRALDRIVTLEDVGDFARASAAIAKAQAVWAWDGRRQVACVTVAGAQGAALDPASTPFANLLAAMLAASDGTFPIALCAYVPRVFTVGATLSVDPSLDADAVVAAARSALRAAFGFDARSFMQPVHASEVIAVLQNVPGVIALTLDALDTPGSASVSATSPSAGDALIARPPQLTGGALAGAELLMIDTGPLPAVVHT